MAQILGGVECSVADGEWFDVIRTSSLLMQHYDLNGCLFGVDNYGGFEPLFAARGLPADCSPTLAQEYSAHALEAYGATWVTLEELMRIDWDETAKQRDERISEYRLDESGGRLFLRKWLHQNELEGVEQELRECPDHEVRLDGQVFTRELLKRSDAIVGTDFRVLLQLMQVLANRFGLENVRMVVWFG